VWLFCGSRDGRWEALSVAQGSLNGWGGNSYFEAFGRLSGIGKKCAGPGEGGWAANENSGARRKTRANVGGGTSGKLRLAAERRCRLVRRVGDIGRDERRVKRCDRGDPGESLAEASKFAAQDGGEGRKKMEEEVIATNVETAC